MTLYRNVNGNNVLLSPAEEAAVRADWANNMPPSNPAKSNPTLQDIISVLSPAQQAAIAAAVQARGST